MMNPQLRMKPVNYDPLPGISRQYLFDHCKRGVPETETTFIVPMKRDQDILTFNIQIERPLDVVREALSNGGMPGNGTREWNLLNANNIFAIIKAMKELLSNWVCEYIYFDCTPSAPVACVAIGRGPRGVDQSTAGNSIIALPISIEKNDAWNEYITELKQLVSMSSTNNTFCMKNSDLENTQLSYIDRCRKLTATYRGGLLVLADMELLANADPFVHHELFS